MIALPETGPTGVRELAAQLKRHRWDVVIDAHHILRSHLLLGLWGRRPDARLAKDTAARLGFMYFGRRSPRLALHMSERFDALFDAIETTGSAVDFLPPLAHLRPTPTVGSPTTASPLLGMAPGAQWDTKRWPEEHFAALLHRFRAQTDGGVRIFVGPRERDWFAASSLAQAAASDAAVQIVQVPDLIEVARNLAAVDALVTNDSGLLHLSEAVGTPVVAFFGPTVRQFGYFPQLTGSRVLETELDCRPCSRNGKRACHRGDLACLTGVAPAAAWDTLAAMLPREGQP
jgi:heptosyltransferase-2